MGELKLCYVDEPWAYFTTQPLSRQWGDDWNDGYYEHNAGPPYEYHEGAGEAPWHIVKVAYYAEQLRTPNHVDERLSVETINNGGIAWLGCPEWAGHGVNIFAGTTLTEFMGLIRKAGGAVYLEARRHIKG